MRSLDDPEIGFIAGLQGEERARYYWWYRKYLLIRRAAWMIGAAQVVCIIAALRAPASTGIVAKIWMLLLFSFLGVLAWSAFLECPRCGQTFQTNNRYELGDECHNCGLTLRQLSSIAKPRL